MFDYSSDLAPDLDWLLQSNQAPPDVILEGLITEFYPAVYALAVSILDYRPAARSLTADIFARALIERHTYRPSMGAAIWLHRIALDAGAGARRRLQARRTLFNSWPFLASSKILGESQPGSMTDAGIWLAVDALDDPTRDLALLHYLHGWKSADLEKLFDVERDDLNFRLERIRSEVRSELKTLSSQTGEDDSAVNPIDEMISASLRRRWPRRDFSPSQIDAAARSISRRAAVKSGRLRNIIAALEVAVILFVIFFATAFFWGADRWFPEPTATPEPGFANQPIGGVTVRPPSTPLPGRETPEWSRRQPPHVHITPGDSWDTVAAELGISAAELKQFNRVPAGAVAEPGTRLLNPLEWPAANAYAAAEPVSPISERRRDLRILLSGPLLYDSVFFDALMIDYGPEAYIGPARVERVQAWLGSGVSLVLTGAAENSLPELVWLRLAQNDDSFSSAAVRPMEDPPWFWSWGRVVRSSGRALRRIPEVFSALLVRGDLGAADNLKIRGRAEWAGVEALIVDQYDSAGKVIGTIWIDDRTGVILRRITFTPGSERIQSVVQIRRLEYNLPIPPDLATTQIPWRGGYAQQASGLPEDPREARQAIKTEVAVIQRPLPSVLDLPSESALGLLPGSTPDPSHTRPQPPDDFEPAQARLSFRLPKTGSAAGQFSTADLFADGYFLAEIPFADPFTMICDRSPDGLWFAFGGAGRSSDNNSGNALRWLYLEDPTTTIRTQPARGAISDLAFSPDASRLAYFETFFRRLDGFLKILDLKTGSVARVINLAAARSLIWSPDGTQLAMIADLEGGLTSEQILIYNLEEDRVQTLSTPLDQSDSEEKDWPVAEWGVEFPVERTGLDHCADPP